MRWNNRLKYLFLLPAVLWLLGFTIYPLLYSLRLGFYNVRIGDSDIFVGFGNFVRAFRDPQVISAARVTLIFVLGGVAIQLVLGVLFALLFNRKLPFRNALRTLMTLPLFATPIAVGFLFFTIFNEEGGLVNGLLNAKIPWLSSPRLSLVSVMIVDTWQWTPFVFIVVLAALQGIPKDYYEAARLETSSPWIQFRYITLPVLQPTIVLVVVLRLAEAFKVFDIPFTLTQGGPGVSSQVFSMYAFRAARRFFDFGYASALSYLLLIIVAFIVAVFFRRIRQVYQ
ncbi:MAG: sugar ABC transporter permease [Deinococcota bacterium]